MKKSNTSMTSDTPKMLPNFKNVETLTIERDLEHEFRDLESGYRTSKSRRIQFNKEYKFQLYGNERPGESSFVDSSIFDAIEWMIPAMIQPLVETNDFMQVKPVAASVQNIIKAQLARESLNYQIRRKNDFYLHLHDILKGFAIGGESFGKLVWIPKDEAAGNPVGYTKIIAVPADQIRYDWTVKNFEDSSVVTQEEDLTRSQVLNLFMKNKNTQTHQHVVNQKDLKEGVIMERFNQAIMTQGSNTKTSYLRDERTEARNYVGERTSNSDVNKGLYLRREQWTMYDIEGNGFMEPVLAVFIDDHLVQVVKNKMPDKQPPFLRGECVRSVDGNPAMGIAELLSTIQKYQTGIMRMFSDNLNSQHNGMYEYDQLNVDQVAIMLLQNAPAGSKVPLPVRKMGSIQPITPAPIASQAFAINEKLDSIKENRSGFTRYSQGSDSKSLNQTATGITQILSRSDLRTWELIMRFSESYMTQMGRKVLSMTQEFMEEQDIELQFNVKPIKLVSSQGVPVTIPGRRAGDWVKINNKDLGGHFDLILDIKSKQETQDQINNNMAWVTNFGPYLQVAGMSPDVIKTVMLTTAKLMGNTEIETTIREEIVHVGTGGVTVPIPAQLAAGAGQENNAPVAGEQQALGNAQQEPGVQGTNTAAIPGV